MAVIGAMIGNPARAAMLAALFDGRALTATELAGLAGVGAATTSAHLAKLVAARLLVCERQGRHRYYRLAGVEVANALEALDRLAVARPVPHRSPTAEAMGLRDARLCYDHLAGRLGVALARGLEAGGAIQPAGRDFHLTAAGTAVMADLGIDVAAARAKRRLFARQCLDWSERRPHFGGALGAALAERAFAAGWIVRTDKRRQVRLTENGRAALSRHLPLALETVPT